MSTVQKTKHQWFIRPYQQGDEDQILDLRGIILSGNKNRQWWQWLCRNGPEGPAIIWVADTGEKIIGHHGLLPLKAKIHDQAVKCCIGFDAMTHPDYRHQRVLSTIDLKLSNAAIEKGIDLSFGVSTRDIYPIYSKMGSSPICKPPILVYLLDWGRALKKRYKIPALVGNTCGYVYKSLRSRSAALSGLDITMEQIQYFDEKFDDFWNKASKVVPIMMFKNREYLNWRYVEKPGTNYKIFTAKRQQEILGFTVVSLVEDESRGEIIDILTLPGQDSITKALVNEALNYFSTEGVELASCLILPHTPYYQIMREIGFLYRDSGLIFGSRIRNPELSHEFIHDFHNWHYVRGDSDIA